MFQDTINQVGVTVQVISVNGKQSAKFAEFGTIKMLISKKDFDHCAGFNMHNNTFMLVHSKLLEEFHQYLSPTLNQLPNYWDDANNKVKESTARKNLAGRFFHTVEIEFEIVETETIDSFDLLQKHVQDNAGYENTLQAHMLEILEMHREKVYECVENSINSQIERDAKKQDEATYLSSQFLQIVIVRNPKLPKAITLELSNVRQIEVSREVNELITRQLLKNLINDYQDARTMRWMRYVTSGVTSHETRLTYLQQIKDVAVMTDVFCADETEVELVYEFAMPWLNRETSNADYSTFLSTLNLMVYKKNYFSLDSIFSDYQKNNKTCHPDGVMN